jgi:hypothetical protein
MRPFSTTSKPYVSKGSYGSGGAAKGDGKAPVAYVKRAGIPAATQEPTSQSVSVEKTARKGKSKMHFQKTVTKVETKEAALRALAVLEANPDLIWACDTEVMDIDLSLVGPVGNGRVTCVSIFGGPDVDFGDGPGTLTHSFCSALFPLSMACMHACMHDTSLTTASSSSSSSSSFLPRAGSALWIDNLGPEGELVQVFKAWFESDEYVFCYTVLPSFFSCCL